MEAFEVAIELARAFTDDATRLVVLGGWILWFADRVNAKRKSGPMISDGPTLGAEAAARVHGATNLDVHRLINCRPLKGDAGLSTDERSMWLRPSTTPPAVKPWPPSVTHRDRLRQVVVSLDRKSTRLNSSP